MDPLCNIVHVAYIFGFTTTAATLTISTLRMLTSASPLDHLAKMVVALEKQESAEASRRSAQVYHQSDAECGFRRE